MSQLSLFSLIIALVGAACALLAALGPGMGFLDKTFSARFNKAGYLMMFVSIGLFILKGILA